MMFEAEQRGKQQGKEEGKYEIILAMYQSGMPTNQIASIVKIDLEELERMIRSKNMAKYVYPAIFTPEEDGGFSIHFPDLEGCYTCGDDLSDGMEMAKDVLALVLYGYETDKKEIPAPSLLSSFHTENGAFVICM